MFVVVLDWIKCICNNDVLEAWTNSPLLDFSFSVSENTGEILGGRKVATYKGLTFSINTNSTTGAYCTIWGSLHKYKNNGTHNNDNFLYCELLDVLKDLETKFNIKPSTTQITALEIGYNIPTTKINPETIIKSAICHKKRTFRPLNDKKRLLGKVCIYSDYSIKIYNKGKQGGINTNVLRLEFKALRQRVLEPCKVQTLLDLKDKNKLNALFLLLFEGLHEIIFFDFSFKGETLTKSKMKSWKQYNNPNLWAELDKNNLYKAKINYLDLLKKYDCKNWGKYCINEATKAHLFFINVKHNFRRLFPQKTVEALKLKKATFSTLECILENVSFKTLKTDTKKSNKFLPIFQKNECLECGQIFTTKNKKSKFCSKSCRNKDSNRRLAIKRKINRAMDKNIFLRITYTYNGVDYTDTLHPNEICLSKQWLDSVKSITRLSASPERIEGDKAKEYLKKNTA